jgi:4-hydroxybenzoyl-CoA thioesterase
MRDDMVSEQQVDPRLGQDRVLARERYRVAMADVDAAGVLYYAAPYRWRERVFTGWLAAVGWPLSTMLGAGQSCPCVESSARYLAPARLDDELDLSLAVQRVGRRSWGDRLEGRTRDGQLVIDVRASLAWVERDADGAMRAHPLPPEFRAAITGGTGSWDADG